MSTSPLRPCPVALLLLVVTDAGHGPTGAAPGDPGPRAASSGHCR
jgi:hypothetical protein